MKNLNIVWGAPCSGKSSYCREQMKGKDVVFDYDEIKKALTYGEKHDTVDWIRDLVQSLRFSWLRTVKDNNEIDDAYMIISRVTENMKSFIEEELKIKPTYHLMESTLEACLARVAEDDSRPDKEAQIEKINQWFQTSEQEKTMKRKLDEGRQYRGIFELQPVEVNKRFDTDYYIEGYATTFEPYELYRDDDDNIIYEWFTKACFDSTEMSDVILQFDHSGRVYARMSNGTLIVEPTEKGLFIAADLSKSQASRDLYDEIKNGLVTRMSWGFRPGEYEYDKATRTLKHISVKKIYDVSAVSIPANENTSIHARSLVNGEIDKLLKERQEREKLELEIELSLS